MSIMSQSIHSKLNRVRKPRVHIIYEVETEGAQIQKELPFVVGVIGDFSGDSNRDLPRLRDRKFVQIDRDNFNDVLARMKPSLSLQVDNLVKGDNSKLPVSLNFTSMEDFEPGKLAANIKEVSDLLEIRNKLKLLLTKADRSPDLEEAIEAVLMSESARNELNDEIKNHPSALPAETPAPSDETKDATPSEEKKS